MKRAAGHISVILRGILFIGFSIQIVLGLIWMCFNFAHLQEFGGTFGILYRMLRGLAGEHYGILYAFQLGIGWYAAHRFLKSLRSVKRSRDIWGSLALLTFPMAMQCHLAVSPYSLAGSLFLLELSALAAAVKGREEGIVREFARGGFCWLFLGLLLPEYFVLGAVPLVSAVLLRLPSFLRRLKRLGLTLVLFAAFGGMIAGINGLAGEKEYLPRRENIAFCLFSRTAWPTIFPDRESWPEEVRAVTEEVMWEVSQHADNIQEILRPVMKESFDDSQAAEYYLEMALYSWKRHMPLVVRQIGGDALSYCVTPLILPMQLRGETYDSYSGRNYEYMFLWTPRLTKYYVNYSCWWFGVMLACAAILTLMKAWGQCGRFLRENAAIVLLCVLNGGFSTALYTMRGAGVQDYKCTVAVNLLWLAWAVLMTENNAVKSEGEGNP